MNLSKVVFAFFIVLALTLNFGFFIGDMQIAAHHNVYELFAAIIVNLIATILKLGERTQVGAVQLAASLVSILQLICAALVWGYAENHVGGLTGEHLATIVSLSGGALVANIVSVILLVTDTLRHNNR